MNGPQQTMPLFRVWIAATDRWRPTRWDDLPPEAVALEPAHDEFLSAEEAAAFVEGFNTTTLARWRSIWAVAAPVRVSYADALSPRQSFSRGDVASFSAGQAQAARESA